MKILTTVILSFFILLQSSEAKFDSTFEEKNDPMSSYQRQNMPNIPNKEEILGQSKTYKNMKAEEGNSKNSEGNDKMVSQNLTPEYQEAMNEAIGLMATNNKNITEISAVVDKLIKYSPVPNKNINSTIIIQKIEAEVRKNVTKTLDEMFGNSKTQSTAVSRFKRAGATCVNTVTQIGTIVGSVVGGSAGAALLTAVLPVIGSTIGAYFGGILGAIALAQIAFWLANRLCP